MTDKIKDQDSQPQASAYAADGADGLSALFNEMRAMMSTFPGAGFNPGAPVSTEEETEAMFDNMPL
ncbi:hypothetical protein EOK75_20135 (plasmid) [Pseudorhodobacter turbinis]|uniref:Uncharacterized protein n=1 Tax=Pseudorhodobacter turbinis TaxID=2500533 RepID=A0A4P8ELK6_9RHOB|nr:hypothetical protein [Pseudorhodobacter turbinis]QCO57958.1 hypothetical protein EOK75_20135 [Pseudorhodobacter turbinis]